jgi:hypothetical protein
MHSDGVPSTNTNTQPTEREKVQEEKETKDLNVNKTHNKRKLSNTSSEEEETSEEEEDGEKEVSSETDTAPNSLTQRAPLEEKQPEQVFVLFFVCVCACVFCSDFWEEAVASNLSFFPVPPCGRTPAPPSHSQHIHSVNLCMMLS